MSSALQRIESASVEATPALASVGRWIAASPIQTLSLSAEDLARESGASVAAVNRFSQAAGFAGFADLKSALASELQQATAPLRKLESAGRSGARRGREAIDTEGLLAAARSVKIDRVAERLLKADQVWLVGLGLSNYVAAYAAHAFTPYVRNAHAIAGPGGTEVAARRLSTVGRADVMLAMTLPRYSRDTVQMAAFARRRGAYVAAITDSMQAPLAGEADAVLLAPCSHPVLAGSALGMLAVVEALAAAVMVRNPKAGQLAREMSDLVLSHLYNA